MKSNRGDLTYARKLQNFKKAGELFLEDGSCSYLSNDTRMEQPTTARDHNQKCFLNDFLQGWMPTEYVYKACGN